MTMNIRLNNELFWSGPSMESSLSLYDFGRPQTTSSLPDHGVLVSNVVACIPPKSTNPQNHPGCGVYTLPFDMIDSVSPCCVPGIDTTA